VFIDLYRFDDELPERFLQQARIETLSIHDANILEAMEALRAAAEEIDFDGCKPPLVFPADSESEDIHAAIVRGDIADRVHDIKLTNATIGEALEEICRQAGAHYVVFEGQIVLILNEIGKKP
jgi:protein gp37